MKFNSFLLSLGLFAGWNCASSKPQTIAPDIPIENRILALLNHPETKFFYSTDKIPRRLLAKAKAVSKREELEYDGVYKLANPGKPFRHGCEPEHGLLYRRLIFIAKLKNENVLCYERGGRGHNLLICFTEYNHNRLNYYNLRVDGISPCSEYSNQEKIRQSLREARVHLLYNNGKPIEHRSSPF